MQRHIFNTKLLATRNDNGTYALAIESGGLIRFRSGDRPDLAAAWAELADFPRKVQAQLDRMLTDRLIAAVRAHALAHYQDGWDIVVESYDDAELAEMIMGANTADQAIAAVAEVLDVVNEHRREIQSTAF